MGYKVRVARALISLNWMAKEINQGQVKNGSIQIRFLKESVAEQFSR